MTSMCLTKRQPLAWVAFGVPIPSLAELLAFFERKWDFRAEQRPIQGTGACKWGPERCLEIHLIVLLCFAEEITSKLSPLISIPSESPIPNCWICSGNTTSHVGLLRGEFSGRALISISTCRLWRREGEAPVYVTHSVSFRRAEGHRCAKHRTEPGETQTENHLHGASSGWAILCCRRVSFAIDFDSGIRSKVSIALRLDKRQSQLKFCRRMRHAIDTNSDSLFQAYALLDRRYQKRMFECGEFKCRRT